VDQARIILALEITARRIPLLVVRVQVLEVEDCTVLRLAIGSVELGGVMMTRLSQSQRRLVQLVTEPVTQSVTVTMTGVPMRIGCDYRHGYVFVMRLIGQHFVANIVMMSLLQQRVAAVDIAITALGHLYEVEDPSGNSRHHRQSSPAQLLHLLEVTALRVRLEIRQGGCPTGIRVVIRLSPRSLGNQEVHHVSA